MSRVSGVESIGSEEHHVVLENGSQASGALSDIGHQGHTLLFGKKVEQGLIRIFGEFFGHLKQIQAIVLRRAFQKHHADVFPWAELRDAVPVVRMLHLADYVFPQFPVCPCLPENLGQTLRIQFQQFRRQQAEKTRASVLVGILVEGHIETVILQCMKLLKHKGNLVLVLAAYGLEVGDFELYAGFADKRDDLVDRGQDVIALAPVMDGEYSIATLYHREQCQKLLSGSKHARSVVQARGKSETSLGNGSIQKTAHFLNFSI